MKYYLIWSKSIMSKIDYLNNYYRQLWWNTSTKLNLNYKTTPYLEKRRNQKKLETVIDIIINHIKNFPKNLNERTLWKETGTKYLEDIISEESIFKFHIIDKKMKSDIFKATANFIKECKTFDKNLSYADIGQAIRNLWIINIFQKIINSDIEFTNAIFGYSMLYPYTDNYLDNPAISSTQKKGFNHRFSQRLKGKLISPDNLHEDKVYKLVGYIESVFDRQNYKELYDSLLLIHNAQEKSLMQQEISSIPYENDILNISIEKGGTSVLADGYLINGALTNEEENFAYGYGFLLQLCDDLQDIENDIKNTHMTIMSQLADKFHLDIITNKLINLTINIIDNAKCFKCTNATELKNLIKTNCITMILFAIAENRKYFSKGYIKEIKKYLSFNLNYIDNIKNKSQKRFKCLKPYYHDVALEDIILYLLE